MLKTLIIVSYFTAIIFATTALSNESRSEDEAFTSSSNVECNYNFTKSGKISFFKEECNDYYINLDFKMKTSILNVTFSVQQLKNYTNLRKTASHSYEDNFNAKVNIYETTMYDDGSEGDILVEEWIENRSEVQRNYLSRTSNAYVYISVTGNWTPYCITFSFDEIPYTLRTVNISSSSGEMEDQYQPNSVSLYRLVENSKKKWESIEITIGDLNISKEMGEYLLIGTGSDIFKSKEYQTLYVSEVMDNSTFYIGSPSAHIVFVAGSIQKIDNRIKILWNRVEAEALPNAKEDPLGVLNSSLICFYNYSAAIQELTKSDSERFKLFRQNFAEFLTFHGKDKNIDSFDETSVVLFGHPTEKKTDTINSKALSLLIKIMHDGKSIFTWNELQKFIEKFEQSEKNISLGYKVGKCPQDNKELPYKDKWSYLIYAIVPVFGLFTLMMWA